MATLNIIPVSSDPDTSYIVTLDGISYKIRLQYLQRLTNESYEGTWSNYTADQFLIHIGLSGEEGYPIRTSLKVNRDILAPYHHRESCPSGILMLRDLLADNTYLTGGLYIPERVTYEDLGVRYVLVYITN
jgi:hypothetical protein